MICFAKHKHPRAFQATYAPNAAPVLVFVYLLTGSRRRINFPLLVFSRNKKATPNARFAGVVLLVAAQVAC